MIQQAIRPNDNLLTIMKRPKVKWYRHISHSSSLAKTILQGTVKSGKKTRQTEDKVGRQHQELGKTGVHQVPEGSAEHRKMEETGCESSVVPTLAANG